MPGAGYSSTIGLEGMPIFPISASAIPPGCVNTGGLRLEPAPPAQPDAQAIASARASFEAELRDAIQNAVRYPSAARLMQLSGKTLVGFEFQDGRVSAIHVLQSSGSDQLDAAALRAVREAYCPPPPPKLAGRLLSFHIWVRFVLQP